MNSVRRTPLDQPVRDRLVSEFDRNFLVEAGAGSGKTHSLATRMAAGIAAGKYTVERMAVVTFTRKAAAELRGRFQLAVQEGLRGKPGTAERQRLEAALSGMERLFAGTIHSFCAHLLRERPVDARIAPGFEELGDIDNLERQRQAWRDFVALSRATCFQPMLDLLEAGLQPKDLDRAFGIVCEHEDVDFDMGAGDAPDATPVWKDVDQFWKDVSALCPPRFDERTTCPLQRRFQEFANRLKPSRRHRINSLPNLLTDLGKLTVVQKWWGEGVGRDPAVGKTVKCLVDRFQEDVAEPFVCQWQAYVHRLSMAVLVEARAFYAERRRRQNVVNYVDLLRVTAAMLRDTPAVRGDLQRKYEFLFIDEFQDTDPIQAEIFLMLAADEGIGNQADEMEAWDPASAGFDPFAVPLRPGALFVVGDPKQSIFRFRRADIDIYNRVAQRIRDSGGEVLSLTANFRSLPDVCAVANAIFPTLFASSSAPYSPRFEKLDAVRAESEAALEPRVLRLTVPDLGKGTRPEEEEARRIAAFIRDEVSSGRHKCGDFLVLTRQTPRLRVFAEALDAVDVPVDVSGAGLFCRSEEVQTLAGLLNALADPLDSAALVGVLRGPLFGLSDPDLFRFHQAGGRFELSAPLPDPAAAGRLDGRDPVLAAIDRLQAMWRRTRELPLAAAVDRMLEETGWLALAATIPAGARAGHLLQAVDRIREVAEEGGGLREAARALGEEAKSSESEALPLEPGRRDVVRLMNLHKAKGLEANVVFLADASHAYEHPIVVRIVRDGGCARGYLKIVREGEELRSQRTLGQPVDWDVHEQEEAKYRDAEILRLLYVAGTRAKDLLAVCQSANPKKNSAWRAFASYVANVPELQLPGTGADAAKATEPGERVGSLEPDAAASAASARAARHDLVRQPSWAVTSVTSGHRGDDSVRPALVALRPCSGAAAACRGGEGRTVPTTASEARTRDPRDDRDPGDGHESQIDAGVAWGSLIHGLLEHAMRHPAATRTDLERLARWLTVETSDLRPFIPEALDLVAAVSQAPFWSDARAGGEVHVEVPCAIGVDATSSPAAVPTVLRGTIDLVYRASDGWRIIDYKTDRDASDASALLDRHGAQVAQYRLMWEQATGTTVESTALFALRTMRVIP